MSGGRTFGTVVEFFRPVVTRERRFEALRERAQRAGIVVSPPVDDHGRECFAVVHGASVIELGSLDALEALLDEVSA